MKVAIVDDSLFSRKRTKEAINKLFESIEMVEFADGEAAVDALPDLEVDFVALDLVMPKLDGFGVLEKLKSIDFKPPVFVLSADIQQSSIQRCLDLGCTEFMSKPLDTNRLSEALKKAEII